jgi:uncharacterized protein
MTTADILKSDIHKSDLIASLKMLEPILRGEGVSGLAIFGSRARGDNTHSSDVDLLVDVAPSEHFSILNIVGIEQIVSERLEIPANVFMRRSLDSSFCNSIRQDEMRVF